MAELLKGRTREMRLCLPLSEGRHIAQIREHGVILSENYEEGVARMHVRLLLHWPHSLKNMKKNSLEKEINESLQRAVRFV